MSIKGFFSFRKNGFFWINILLMLLVIAVLLFGVLYALDKYTRHGQSVEVPDVKGLTVPEASNMIKKRGLRIQVMDSVYVKELTPGRVLEQNPSDGMRVKKGRIVFLTINTLSVPLQIVPDVADNSSLRQAQAKLLAAGFKLTEEEYISGEKDWVYGVKYNGRELRSEDKVPVGATLTLLVGEGMQPFEMDTVVEEEIIYIERSSEPVVDESWF